MKNLANKRPTVTRASSRPAGRSAGLHTDRRGRCQVPVAVPSDQPSRKVVRQLMLQRKAVAGASCLLRDELCSDPVAKRPPSTVAEVEVTLFLYPVALSPISRTHGVLLRKHNPGSLCRDALLYSTCVHLPSFLQVTPERKTWHLQKGLMIDR